MKIAYKIQTRGSYPEESIQHSEHGKSLKSRKIFRFFLYDTKYFILALYHDTKNCTKKENRTVQERNVLKTAL